eukprot:2711717-Pyramimonas_sp.AAC.1
MLAIQHPMGAPSGGKMGLPMMPAPRKILYQVKRTNPHAGVPMTAAQIQAQRGAWIVQQQVRCNK